MTTFKFNFAGDEITKNQQEKGEIKWLKCEEVIPDQQIINLDDIVIRAKMFVCQDIEIGHVHTNNVMPKLCSTSAIDCAEKNHSDLVEGIYEGGLKIWECTYDLVEFLINNEDRIDLNNKKVLDLGCGTGILGIYTFQKGALVTFQDYNKEVLEHITIPNVLLNIEEEARDYDIKKCKFYSGDWASFNGLLAESELYDIILTSETIYNESNYEKLIDLFKKRISDNGSIYIAAKTCYFGVGGGIRQFELIVLNDGSFNMEVCWKSDGGIQREILKLTKKL